MAARVSERVECVGPKCGTIVSMVTARREGWVRIKGSDGSKLTPVKDRTHMGWCRKCAREFGVVEYTKEELQGLQA